MPESLRKFADRIGVSDTAIRKAIKAGRLEGFVGQTGEGKPCITDPEGAAAKWAATSYRGGGLEGATAAAREPAANPSSSHVVSPDPAGGPTWSPMPNEPEAPAGARIISASTLTEAQKLATIERARKLQLENNEREGQLVPVAEAKREAFDGARIIRESMLNIPPRVAGELAAEKDPSRVQIILEAAIRAALDATADELLTSLA